MGTLSWFIWKLGRFFIWLFFTVLLPGLLFIIGANIFLRGIGSNLSIPYNSLTFLGLWIARFALPVTPESEPIRFIPLKKTDDLKKFEDELSKAIEKELQKDKKDDDSSGPSSKGN